MIWETSTGIALSNVGTHDCPKLPSARSPQYRHKICIKQRPLYVPAAKPSTLTVRRMAVRSRWLASFCKYRLLPIPTNKSTMRPIASVQETCGSLCQRANGKTDKIGGLLPYSCRPIRVVVPTVIPNSRSSMSALSSF